MSESTRYDRRHFIAAAVTALAGAGLLASRVGDAVDAGAPKARYAEAGPSDGPPAILLHGAPRGINGDVDVASLVAGGYRVIRAYGSVSDVMALMAVLELEKALVGGYDEGAQTAEVMAAMWPRRLKAIASVDASGVVTLAANQRPLPPKEELAWWYRYYFRRDEDGCQKHLDLAKTIQRKLAR